MQFNTFGADIDKLFMIKKYQNLLKPQILLNLLNILFIIIILINLI